MVKKQSVKNIVLKKKSKNRKQSKKNKQNSRKKNKQNKQNKKGGYFNKKNNTVSLKSAVKILRKYYEQTQLNN